LLLAHTASDQAETVLMRLLRGTGLHGLTGIPAISRLPYQKDSTLVMGRPLLDVWRSDIEQYCQENNLKFRSDSTNTSLDYLRNRVRLELLPLLEEKYQKGTAENLVRLAYIASAEERWLTELTATAFTELSEIFTDSILLDINKLLSHPAALQRRLVRLAFEKLTGDTTDLTANHVELILQNLTRPVWRMNLPQELIIQVYNGRLQVSLTGAAGPFYPVLQTTEEKVLEPGKIANFGNWQLKFEEFVPPYPFEENPLVQYLDGEKINYNLLVRIRKPGEKFWPLGAPGHRKLQDFMVDRKIPRQYRDNWPLIIARYPTSEQVVWVVGQAISEEFKITAETRRVLRFEVILSLL
jgi:tRNA(Ile)-lysidine synthase